MSFEQYLNENSSECPAARLGPMERDERDLVIYGFGVPEKFSKNLGRLAALVKVATSQKYGGGDPQKGDAEEFSKLYKEDINEILKFKDLDRRLEAYKNARSVEYGEGRPTKRQAESFKSKYGLDMGEVLAKINDTENRFEVLKKIEDARRQLLN
ncbi:MAG: hypothetical protein WC797_00365 [Candidatus Paceibacterota bacterium]|jgi:hypothetical protein